MICPSPTPSVKDTNCCCIVSNQNEMDQIKFSLQFQLVIISMESKIVKATSYKDLIKNFHQAETVMTAREKRPSTRPLQLKKSQNNNKQNQFSKNHVQSTGEKLQSHNVSEWVEQEVLREYNHKRKDKQLQLSYHKFIGYITNIMSNIAGQVPPELLTLKLTYLQFLAALKQTAFIKDTYQPTPTDVVTELWNELVCNGQTVGVFIIFASAILNMKKSDEDNPKYQYMWKKYSDLRYTRMETFGKMKTTNQNQDEFPFTPTISKRSRTLAASRSKSKNCKEKCLVQKSYHQMLEESQDSQHNSSNNREILFDSKAGSRRSQILYKLAKEKSLQKRRDKKSSQVEYQKSIKQLTFHPKIHPNNKEKPKKKVIQGEQDSIDRMIRGRIQRQVRKIITQRGLPYNQKMFQKMKKEKYEALMRSTKNLVSPDEDCSQSFSKQQLVQLPQPQNQQKTVQIREKGNGPLVLSVQVDEGRIQKLIIHEGQCYKEVAAKFIQDMKLGSDLYEKLILGVENALRCQLTQIDEDSFESEFQSNC